MKTNGKNHKRWSFLLVFVMVLSLLSVMTTGASADNSTVKLRISYNGEIKTVTEAQWEEMAAEAVTEDYSVRPRDPNPPEVRSKTGVTINAILETAGINVNDLDDDQNITFTSASDSLSRTLSVKEALRSGRFSYELATDGEGNADLDSETGRAVPVIITSVKDGDEEDGRLIVGQKDSTEYNNLYWIKGMFAKADSDIAITISAKQTTDPEMPGFASGTGTKDDPYMISSADQLKYLQEQVNGGESFEGKYIRLSSDIDLGSENWTPIGGGAAQSDGTAAYKFMGTFDGNGKTIKNLNINTSADFTGLFGYNSGTLKDFTVEGSVTVNGSYNYVSGVCGFNAGTIQRVINKADITAATVDAGTGKVTTGSFGTGGIAGVNVGGKWDEYKAGEDSKTVQDLEGAEGVILECGNEGNLTVYRSSGGITGSNYGIVNRCYNKGDIDIKFNGSMSKNGGIAGSCGNTNAENGIGHIVSCYNTGAVKWSGNASARGYGGIVCFISKSSSVTNCYSTGSIQSGYNDYTPIIPRYDTNKLIVNNYSLKGITTSSSSEWATGTIKTEAEMKSDKFVEEIGGSFTASEDGAPVLKWEKGKSLKAVSIESDLSEVQTDYIEGKTFDLVGAVFSIVYDDGSKELINNANCSVSSTEALKLSDDGTEVKVTCTSHGITSTEKIKITVDGKKLSGVNISTLPKKYIYKAGEEFDPTGLKIKTEYSNYNTQYLNYDPKTMKCETGGKLTDDNKTVTVKYTLNGVTREDSFDVIVVDELKAPEKDENGTYLLKTKNDMIWLSNQVTYLKNTDINAKLMNDIDLSNAEDFEPVGTKESLSVQSKNGAKLTYAMNANAYGGVFEGNGKTVTLGLDTTSSAALFGSTKNAAVKDLTIAGSVKSSSNAGAIVGDVSGGTLEIINCTNKADITGSGNNATYLGGMVATGASASGINITGCTNTGKITATDGAYSGGMIGNGAKSTVTDCINKGDVTGNRAGGIAAAGGYAVRCVNEGDVTGESSIGGIIGNVAKTNGTITECANTGNIKGEDSVGGIAGSGYLSAVSKCYNKGNVEATKGTVKYGAGGLVGTKATFYSLSVSDSYNTGTVTASGTSEDGSAGELIGAVTGNVNKKATITNSYYYQKSGENKKAVGSTPDGVTDDASAPKTLVQLSEMAEVLGDAYQNSCGGAVFTWQKAAAHDMSDWSDDDATFTEDGHQVKTCGVCGKTETRVTEATGVKITIESIDAIGTVTLDSEDAIKTARDNYGKLTDVQKTKITNYDVLTSAEAKLASLKSDKAAAENAEAKIAAIGDPVTLESKAAIDVARQTYDSLTADQKKLVTNYDVLTSAEAAYEKVKEAADKDEADKAAADAVTALVDKISDEVTFKDKEAVEDAETAYEKLTEDQKNKVSDKTKKKLSDAVAKIDELKAAVTDAEALINAIPADITGTEDDIFAVLTALEGYNDLSDDQKAQLSGASKERLKSALGDLKVLNHTSNGVTVDGLDTFVKVTAVPVTEGVEYDAVKNHKQGKTLLAMYDISLKYYRLVDKKLVEEEYLLRGQSVKITITNDSFAGHEKPVGIHLTENINEQGAFIFEELKAALSGNVAELNVTETGNISIMAEKAAAAESKTDKTAISATGDAADMALVLALMILAATGAVTLGIRRKRS